MYRTRAIPIILVALTLLTWSLTSVAELQTVTIGGEIRVRGYYWQNSFNGGVATGLALPQVRWPAAWLDGRPIGDIIGGQNAMSYWDWDSRGPDYKLVAERTELSVRADFTDDVAAVISLDSFDFWGEDFRSNYITGADARAATADDVEFYQAYIEVDQLFGNPLRLRVGRQEITLGSGWLVGNGSARAEFTGTSFDGVRLTYICDPLTVDAFWTKLAERSPVEEDGDVDMYGVYASYVAPNEVLWVDNFELDAYWLLVRDGRAIEDVNGTFFQEWLEEVVGIDDYGPTYLHTVGLRAAGTLWNFDGEAEFAYQFGDANQVGTLFKRFAYGDDDADYSNWAMNLELGYTFDDVTWQPRLHAGLGYFGGEDNRYLYFWEWINPFKAPEASVSFNRLFSNKVYSYMIDEMAQLSNFYTINGGIELNPTEKVELNLAAAYFHVIEEFNHPIFVDIGRLRIPLAPGLPWLTRTADSDLGWEASLSAKYAYSSDLSFEVGWSHFFVDDGLAVGNYNDYNGLLYTGGTDDDDADYFYAETKVCF